MNCSDCKNEDRIGDGICDDAAKAAFTGDNDLNRPQYGYDGGDCCAHTNPLINTDAKCLQPGCKGLRTATGFGAWSACSNAGLSCGAKRSRTCTHPQGSLAEFNFCFSDDSIVSRNAAGNLVQSEWCPYSALPAGATPCIWTNVAPCSNVCNPSLAIRVGQRYQALTCAPGIAGATYNVPGQPKVCTTPGTKDTVACVDTDDLCEWQSSRDLTPIWDTTRCDRDGNGVKYQYCSQVPVPGRLVKTGAIVVRSEGENDSSDDGTDSGGKGDELPPGGGDELTPIELQIQGTPIPWNWPTRSPTSSGPIADQPISAAQQEELNPNCVGADHIKDNVWLVKKRSCKSY